MSFKPTRSLTETVRH